MNRRRGLAALATAVTVTLAGCAADDEPTGRDAGQTQGTPFNQADVRFAQAMIPHHQQAVEMAQLASERAASADVEKLAADIEAAQGPEIETMTGWLESWDEEVPEGMNGTGEMDHGDMGADGESGMMDDPEMTDLEAATGADFDRRFLTLMIEHHEGAIEMAVDEQADGEHPDALALAEQIESDQQAEIQLMEELLDS